MIAAVTHCNGPARGVGVLIGHDLLERGDRDAVIGHFIRIDLDNDLALLAAGDIDLEHAGNRFDVFFQVIGDFFKPRHTGGPMQGIHHDRQFREVDLEYRGVVLEIRRQIPFGFIHLVLYLLEDVIDIGSRNKLDIDIGFAF